MSFRAGSGVLALLLVLFAAVAASSDESDAVTVFRSPSCGCCSKWAEHLRGSGFQVQIHEVSDLGAIKARYGVPRALSSCHTALVGDYVIEGHVPAADIRRLLRERPEIVGLAVPGMPGGSPGMEGPVVEPYDVIAFDGAGRTSVFAQH